MKEDADWKCDWTERGFETHQPELRIKSPSKENGIKLLMQRSISIFTYRKHFSVINGNQRLEIQGAEWADWDRRGRLVFARSGRVHCANLDSFPQLRETELIDLSPLKPKPVASPDWAKQW